MVVFLTAFGRYHSVVDYHSVPAKREEEGLCSLGVSWPGCGERGGDTVHTKWLLLSGGECRILYLNTELRRL